MLFTLKLLNSYEKIIVFTYHKSNLFQSSNETGRKVEPGEKGCWPSLLNLALKALPATFYSNLG